MLTIKKFDFKFLLEKSIIVKYLFSILLTLATLQGGENGNLILVSFLELFAIFIVSNLCFSLNKYLAQVLSFLLLLFYNIEQLSLLLAGTYVSPVMLSNLDSLEALSGRMGLYVSATIVLLIFSVLPVRHIQLDRRAQSLGLFASLLLVFNLFYIGYIENSPHYNWYSLIEHRREQAAISRRIREKGAESAKRFYKESVSDGIKKPAELPEKPNVILIFAEGLSQSIIDDQRTILPQVRELQQKSLNFENYYNHTFATYAGLIGQLYSGYQFNNFDSNSLVSIEDVLENEGYQSIFVNTEPGNKEFTDYLERFDYQKLVTENLNRNLTDKEAYQLLFDTVEKASAKKSDPFFISMYTFGTHLSLDSPDKKFGDGKDANLNKFYNMDYQFGLFLDKFRQSELSKNTILIFTTDHATYVDDSYFATFGPNRKVGNLDQVPFFIYYEGIVPQRVDAQGKNSLSLVPTILDFLDESAPNYFLGESLFSDEASSFNYIFYSEGTWFTTKDSEIHLIKEEEKEELKGMLEDYFAAKLK